MSRRHPFSAVNLISDPIHGYVELSKRLAPREARAAGLPEEAVAVANRKLAIINAAYDRLRKERGLVAA